MSYKNLSPFDKVEIIWRDASYIKDAGWKTKQDIETWLNERIVYKEIGYFYCFKNDSIVLCGGYSIYSNSINELCGVKTIPAGCVISVKKL